MAYNYIQFDDINAVYELEDSPELSKILVNLQSKVLTMIKSYTQHYYDMEHEFKLHGDQRDEAIVFIASQMILYYYAMRNGGPQYDDVWSDRFKHCMDQLKMIQNGRITISVKPKDPPKGTPEGENTGDNINYGTFNVSRDYGGY